MRTSLITRVAVVTSVGAALLAMTVPAQAAPAQVTRGDFVRTGLSADAPQLEGTAQLVRTGNGHTMLTVHLTGLMAGETYGVHLHNAPCSASFGGAHYKFDPAGVATPPNELWASSSAHDPMAGITANAAGNARGRGTAAWRAGSAAQAVVIHIGASHGGTTAGGTKLACADLS